MDQFLKGLCQTNHQKIQGNYFIFFLFLLNNNYFSKNNIILSRVIMQCTFSGNFEIEHKKLKKRRLIRPAIDNALKSILDNNISCETYRENEAVRLMNIGDYYNFILGTNFICQNIFTYLCFWSGYNFLLMTDFLPPFFCNIL